MKRNAGTSEVRLSSAGVALLCALLAAIVVIAIARHAGVPSAASGAQESEPSAGDAAKTLLITRHPLHGASTALARDPFARERVDPAPEVPRLAPPSEDRFRLSAVLISDHPRAVINDTILAVGDTIEGFRVARIRADGVTLVSDAHTIELTDRARHGTR